MAKSKEVVNQDPKNVAVGSGPEQLELLREPKPA